jgi:teichuronic acid biosynthesis glycosyltransferase TuaC
MNSVKRILWISDYFPRPHDTTLGVWGLESVKAIIRKGIEVIVFSPTPWLPKLLFFTSRLRKLNQVPLKYTFNSVNIFYPRCPHYPHRLVIKYIYNYFPYFETSFLIRWLNPVLKEIVQNYSFDAVHSNFIFPGGYIGYAIKNQYNVPFVVHERSVKRMSDALQHKLRKELYSKIINEADAVISPSRKIAGTIEQLLGNNKKVKVIRDPGSHSTLNTTGIFQLKPEKYRNKKIILSVGSLIERKGHEYLIKAVNILKEEFENIICIIIGSGVRKRYLDKLVKSLNLNSYIEMAGKLPHDEVLKFMSWCSIFVLPSWDEAFGTVYGEAMAFGKPVIACKNEGLSEMIENGIHGFLVNKRDEGDIASAVKKILTDDMLEASMGSASKILVEKNLNYDFMASEIVDLYNSIAAGK